MMTFLLRIKCPQGILRQTDMQIPLRIKCSNYSKNVNLSHTYICDIETKTVEIQQQVNLLHICMLAQVRLRSLYPTQLEHNLCIFMNIQLKFNYFHVSSESRT